MSFFRLFDKAQPCKVDEIPFVYGQHEIVVPFPDGGSSIRIRKVAEGLAIVAQGADVESMLVDISDAIGEIVVRPKRKPWLEPSVQFWAAEEL